MSRRSTPAFAIGGIPYLDHMGEVTSIEDCPPTGWRCFHCNMHFTHWRAALRHFGMPGAKKIPLCIRGENDV